MSVLPGIGTESALNTLSDSVSESVGVMPSAWFS